MQVKLLFLTGFTAATVMTLTGTRTKYMQGLYFKAFSESLLDTLYCKHRQCFISVWQLSFYCVPASTALSLIAKESHVLP